MVVDATSPNPSVGTFTEAANPEPEDKDTSKLARAVTTTLVEAVNPVAVKVKDCSVAADPYVAVNAVMLPLGVMDCATAVNAVSRKKKGIKILSKIFDFMSLVLIEKFLNAVLKIKAVGGYG